MTIASFGAASVASYRPGGRTDRTLAVETLKRALGTLDDDALESTTRIGMYRDGLERTEALLRRVLLGNPTDTAGIERLAMVRWELGVLAGTPDEDAVSAMIAIAAVRAPRIPDIQVDLGTLLYKMGRLNEATPFMTRAVELSPTMTNRVVAVMQAAGVPPDAIVMTLPPVPEVLIAVKGLFLAAGQGPAYLDHVEPRLVGATPAVLEAYGDACLELRVPERLRDRIAGLPTTQDPAVRAERFCQAAHAWFALGDPNHALALADQARQTSPTDARLLEFYGEVALAAGQGAEAETAFRRSLELVLEQGVPPARRARLYDAIGRSLEAQDRGEIAYDAFRRAVALDPSARNAVARVEAYEHRGSGSPR
jgi:tetratricopeptide (TPR) repeat protein